MKRFLAILAAAALLGFAPNAKAQAFDDWIYSDYYDPYYGNDSGPYTQHPTEEYGGYGGYDYGYDDFDYGYDYGYDYDDYWTYPDYNTWEPL